MSETMRYEAFERAENNYAADTVGLWPGIAGVYLEGDADVYCPKCAHDILGDELFATVKRENTRTDEHGSVSAVLSSEEWDCPGATCGHCAIRLDVSVIHYDGVCNPDWCDSTA